MRRGILRRARNLTVALSLLSITSFVVATSGLGSSTAGASARPRAATGGTASYALAAGETYTWVLPLESVVGDEPYETNIENEMYLPLLWYGTGSQAGINYHFSIAKPPVWSNGNRTVTIHMKNTYKWSTGAPVNTQDIKFFFQFYEAAKANIGNYVPGLIPDNVASVTYPGSYTFVLHLKHAFNPVWYDGNQLGRIYPLPVQAWDRTSPTGPSNLANSSTTAGAKAVATFIWTQAKDQATYTSNPLWKVVDGPFVTTSFDPVTHTAKFARNAHYTGPTKPHLKSYTVDSFATGTAELNALRSGKITFGWLPYGDLSQRSYFQSHGSTVKTWPIFYDQAIELGYTSKQWGPLVRQLYIRQALQHLITEKLYIQRALGGFALQDYGAVADYPGSNLVAPALRKDPYPYSLSAATKLLTSHGWVKGSNGFDTCKRPGTKANECGAGIAKGRELTFLYYYSTGTTAFFAEVSQFDAAARKAGIDFKLDGAANNTMYATIGVCPSTPPCNWGLAGYSGWFWNYGQYGIVPVGDEQFGKGNYWAGGYTSPTSQKLIAKAETVGGTKSLYADEAFLSKDVASLWWPLQDWSIAVVSNSLGGWQQLSPYGAYTVQRWYFKK